MGMSTYDQDVKVKEVTTDPIAVTIAEAAATFAPVTKSEILDALVSSGQYALVNRIEQAGII